MSSAHCGTQNTGSSRAKVPDVGVVGEGFFAYFSHFVGRGRSVKD